jgi:N-acetylneuraminic acid mutarotase
VDASDRHFAAVNASPTRLLTNSEAPAAGRLDLLTAILHEMGHTLGLEDSYLAQDRDSLMYGFLTLGERRLPAKRQAFGVRPHDHNHAETHFLTGAVNIGVLPPGKSVTIIYDVIINNPATTATLSSQATVSGSNFTNVLTDDLVSGGDPLLPGAADHTVTLIELPDVSVTVAPASTAEDGAGNLVYTFTRTGATTTDLTVGFAATGTASATDDYSVTSGTGVVIFTPGTGFGTIVIPTGSSTATAIVDPSVDTTVEADETVIVGISSGLYDIVAPVSATGTITNDDVAVSIDPLPDTSLFEDQTLNFSYTFRRTGSTTGITVANFTVGGGAAFGTDYAQSGATTFTTSTGTVTFNAGETTKVITLDPTADNSVESNETIVLTVTSGAGYNVISPTNQTATIVDDDVSVSLTSVVPNTSVEDSGTGMVYTFTRSGGSTANALTANVTISGTAGFTGDYTTSGFATNNLAGAATITFAGGSATKTVTITPSADVTNEPDETVILTVAANGTPAVTGGYEVGGTPSGTGTILNDDTQVSVAVTPSPVGEASGTGMVYTFTRTGSTAAAQLVNFTKSGTASLAGTDFSVASTDGGMDYSAGTVTIPIGSSTVTITLTPLEDALVEGSETAILTVAAGSGYAPSGSPATGTITDNDTATIGYVAASSTVGEATANDVQQLVLTLTTTGAGTPTLAYPVTVNVTGPGGTATSGTDYTPPTGVTFPANSLDAAQVPASIAIINDRAVEGTETAGLGLAINTDGTGGAVTIALGAAATHTTTITDNDTATVSYSGSASSVGEGAGNDVIGLTLTVVGNGTGPLVLERSASFNVTTTGGTATDGGTDYTLPAAVSIPATTLDGAVTNFNLAITNDQLVEGSETAILGLTLNTDNTGGQVSVGAGIAHTTTITDNDTANITFAAPTSNVAENAGPDVMNLVLTIVGNGVGTAQLTSAISVNVTDAGGGTAAGAGVDYTLPALITFPANSLSAATQPASLGITDDAIVETNETVNLGLAINTDLTGAVSIGAANTHVTTILDNDTATISFAKIIDGSEGPPIVNGKFRITQTAQSATNTVVNYTVGGTAVPGPGNDYATLSGTATILAGNTFVDVDVIVQADVGSEPPETVIITFLSFGLHDADITLGAPSSATLSIFSGSIITGTWNGDPLISTAGSFDCTGLTLDIDLGFVPTIGVPYTLIHADGGIIGNFNDLPPNGVIALSINGVIYYFQATYGPNDVILTPFTPAGPAEWTWVSGPSSRNGVGVYGSLGVAAPTNNPGARQGAMNWYSPDGSLWMFGGYGYATAVTSPPRYLNDIWQYDRALGRWIWQGGANTFNSPGTYGTIGVEAPGNAPGARHTGTTWTDADGDLWLFGGYGIGASGAPAWLNDLWRFDRTSKQWTHMKGSTATGGAATYGVQGTPAPGNTPGARSSATGFFRDGNLWLFGGYNGTSYYNDLWRYEIATGNWAWMEGSNTPNINGTYGTQGTPSAANTPGSRRDATGWTASDGTLWLFGGLGLPASGTTAGDMSDLWRYDPVSGEWTWIKGVNTLNAVGVYGTQNTPAPGNLPSARSAGSGWITVDGDLWLVGGFKNSGLTYDDVWIYDIASNQWTWKLGSAGLLNQPGVYGTQGTAAPANKPGGRFTPSTWVTLNGSLWIFGGGGADAFGNTGRMSDLWRYSIPKPAGATYDEGTPDAFPSDLIVNGDPNANDATAGTMAYVPVSGKLTGTDPDGDRLLFSSAGSTTLSQGTLTLNKDGTWTYTPAYGFTGVASFQFKAADNYGGESSVKSLVISVITNPADSDGDGIADAYEQSIWGSLAAADGDGDADLDGQSNYFEFLAGTNPLDGNETLSTSPTVTGTTSASGHVQLQLNHVRPGVNYHLETSSDLDAWTRLGTFTFDVSGSATIEDPTPSTGAPKFYRMSLEATPAIVVP